MGPCQPPGLDSPGHQEKSLNKLGTAPDTLTCVSPTSFSALHHAALGGSLELIALLLEAQATVDIKDSNGESPGELSIP